MGNLWSVRTLVCSFLAILLFAGSTLAQERPNSATEENRNEAKPGRGNSETAKAEEQEPAAGGGTEALQKATQNPVASLISVPVQNNNNFGVSPGYRTQDVLNIQPVVPIGISRDWNLIIRWITPIIWQPLPGPPSTPGTGVFGFGDMVPTLFLSPAKPGKLIWGVGPVFPVTHGNEHISRAGEAGNGAVRRCADATRPLDAGGSSKQHLVCGRFGQPSIGQPVPAAVLHQLQPEEGLVHHLATYPDSQLGGHQWRPMGSAVWWGRGKNHETRIPAGLSHRTVLLQRHSSSGHFALGHAVTDCVALPQVE